MTSVAQKPQYVSKPALNASGDTYNANLIIRRFANGNASKWMQYSLVVRNGKRYIREERHNMDRLLEITGTVNMMLAKLCTTLRYDSDVQVGPKGELLIEKLSKLHAKRVA